MHIAIPITTAAILYTIFLLWYGGWGKPMSQEEAQGLILNLKRAGGKENDPDNELIQHFREVVKNDDGKAFIMVNLMKFKKTNEAKAANARYSKKIFPLLLKHGSPPIFVSNVQGRFLHLEGSDDWDQVAFIRYRSRKDFLKMAADAAKLDLGKDKWLSLEKTHVFPVKPIFHLSSLRIGVAVVLITLTSVISLLFT